MKIIISRGCTSDSFTVDDKPIQELNELDILEKLLPKIREGVANKTISLQDVVHLFQTDDYHYDSESCDTCGDNVETFTWSL